MWYLIQDLDNAKRSRRRFWLIAIAAVVAAGVLLAFLAVRWDRRAQVRAALAWNRLASLPPSARNVEVSTVGNMFSRNFFLKFEADPAEIATFVASSSGLREAKEAPLDEHTIDEDNGAKRFAWFDRGAVRVGRRWIVPPDEHENYGVVVVDDARHLVYIISEHS